MHLSIADIPFQKVNVLWASPPCDVWSYAAGSFHWDKEGNPKTEKCKIHLEIMRKTLSIIEVINPDIFFIENPRGRLRYWEELDSFLKKRQGVIKTLTFSSYGLGIIKPTNIFTNAADYNPRELGRYGRGAKNNLIFDNLTKCQKQKLPAELVKEIADYCENKIAQTTNG